MAITDWPEGERPRERLLAHGPQALSDAELLAIYLRVGVRGKSAVDLARDLLQRFDGQLGALVEASLEELASVSGIGMAKAAQLKASFELARRALGQEMASRDTFSAPGKVRDWLRLKLAARPHEVFMALWLDAQNRLIKADELFSGTLTQTSVYPREVVKAALAHNAPTAIRPSINRPIPHWIANTPRKITRLKAVRARPASSDGNAMATAGCDGVTKLHAMQYSASMAPVCGTSMSGAAMISASTRKLAGKPRLIKRSAPNP